MDEKVSFKKSISHGIFIILIPRWRPLPEIRREITCGHQYLSIRQFVLHSKIQKLNVEDKCKTTFTQQDLGDSI
jgi:hypothetical protein